MHQWWCRRGWGHGERSKPIETISAQLPAILLSGKVRIYDRDTQADVFLPKGMYAPVELLERIRLLLVRKRGPKRAQSQPQTTGRVGAA